MPSHQGMGARLAHLMVALVGATLTFTVLLCGPIGHSLHEMVNPDHTGQLLLSQHLPHPKMSSADEADREESLSSQRANHRSTGISSETMAKDAVIGAGDEFGERHSDSACGRSARKLAEFEFSTALLPTAIFTMGTGLRAPSSQVRIPAFALRSRCLFLEHGINRC